MKDDNNWMQMLNTDYIVESLLMDMEQLRTGEWVPDDDSIAAHCEYITELQRRIT